MSVVMQLNNYNDFKAAAAAFPEKGLVFWCCNGSTSFSCVFINSRDSFVLALSLESKPATFAADYPGAIQLTPPGNSFQFPVSSSTTWNLSVG